MTDKKNSIVYAWYPEMYQPKTTEEIRAYDEAINQVLVRCKELEDSYLRLAADFDDIGDTELADRHRQAYLTVKKVSDYIVELFQGYVSCGDKK